MYCKKCGNKLKGNEAVCSHCGAQVIHNEYMLGFWDLTEGKQNPEVPEKKVAESEAPIPQPPVTPQPVEDPNTVTLKLNKDIIRKLMICLLIFLLILCVGGLLIRHSMKKKDDRIRELKERVQELEQEFESSEEAAPEENRVQEYDQSQSSEFPGNQPDEPKDSDQSSPEEINGTPAEDNVGPDSFDQDPIIQELPVDNYEEPESYEPEQFNQDTSGEIDVQE